MTKILGFIKAMLSEKGEPSCKRVVGTLMVIVVSTCVIIESAKRGITTNVENILQTMLVCACSLIGLYSVTNIFKKNDNN